MLQFHLIFGHGVLVGTACVLAHVFLSGVVEDGEGVRVQNVHVVLRRQRAVNDAEHLACRGPEMQHGLQVPEAQEQVSFLEMGAAVQGRLHVVQVHGILGVP